MMQWRCTLLAHLLPPCVMLLQAFSATGAIEGVNAIKTGELVSLSEQELVSSNQQLCFGGVLSRVECSAVLAGQLVAVTLAYDEGSGSVPALHFSDRDCRSGSDHRQP